MIGRAAVSWGTWCVAVAAIVSGRTPVLPQSTKPPALYLTALPPLDESAIHPLRDVVPVDPAQAFRFYVVLEAPSVESRVEDLRVDAVNQPASAGAPVANLSVRVFRVDASTPVEVPVRISTSGGGNHLQWHFCGVSLDVPQLPAEAAARADRDRVFSGMARSRHLPVRNPPGLYEVRVTYAAALDRSGRSILEAPGVRFRVAGEPSPAVPLPPTARTPARPVSGTPAEVVTAYYRALNAGAGDEVALLSSASLARAVTPGPDERAMLGAVARRVTRDGTITRVDVLGERQDGARAWVDVRLFYRDGSSQKYNAGVVQEDGAWKIADE
jgi:hypothetical protein